MDEKKMFEAEELASAVNEDTGEAAEMSAVENQIVLEEAPKNVSPVEEICELRAENRKVFRMSDGTEQAVFYPNAVHVFDQDTQSYEELDNDLVDEEDGKHMRNGKNRFIARFNKDEDDDEIFSVEQDNYRIRMSVAKQHRKGGKWQAHRHDHRRNQMRFCNEHGNTEMEYIVCNDGVKEDIIVNAKSDEYRYPFVVECDNLVAVLQNNGKRVAFIDPLTNDEVFYTPAPFMTDANGELSKAVSYELIPQENSVALFTVVADSEWMNAEERAFPVTIDPQVILYGSSDMSVCGWHGIQGYTGDATTRSFGVGVPGSIPSRMVLSLNAPVLPNNVRIKKAELTLEHGGNSYPTDEAPPLLGVYEMTSALDTTLTTCPHAEYPLDYVHTFFDECDVNTGAPYKYTFDITKLMDKLANGETDHMDVVVRVVDETLVNKGAVILYGTGAGPTSVPMLTVTYESSYGSNSAYASHTHELGSFGQASVDLQTRNLMMDLTDFAWGGNRMPVTIKHVYNSAFGFTQYSGINYQGASNGRLSYLADFSAMDIGYGWRLNLMQSIRPFSFIYEGTSYSGYAFADENGEVTYFKKSTTQYYDAFTEEKYYDQYEDVNDDTVKYVPGLYKMWIGDETRVFDSAGRLIEILDTYGNEMTITYTDGRISSVTDGAGRTFTFTYSGDYLSSIASPNGKTLVEYTYVGDRLTEICYPENKSLLITYPSSGYQIQTIMVCENDVGISGFQYTYSDTDSDRLSSVYEFTSKDGVRVFGNTSSFAYSAAAKRAVVTTTEVADADVSDSESITIKTVYCFDDDGNVISTYAHTADTGNTGLNGKAGNGVHPYLAENGMGIIPQSTNLLLNHSFEIGQTAWGHMDNNLDDTTIVCKESNAYAKYGSHYLEMNSQNETAVTNGVYQEVTISGGEHTFSAYVSVRKNFSTSTDTAGAYLRVTTTDGTILAESEHLTDYFPEYVRLVLPFELETAQCVKVCILLDGNGTIYVDAAQLEDNPFANDYNLLTNGNFEYDLTDWCHDDTTGTTFATDQFNGAKALRIVGDLSKRCSVYQPVSVKTGRGDKEVFTLSGWAKASSVPLGDRGNEKESTFCLRAAIKYYDSEYKEYGTERDIVAVFSPCTEEWQFASVQFEKSKYRIIQDIKIYCEYNYNTGVALFDDIQLIRNSYGSGFSEGDFSGESVSSYADDAEETTDDQDENLDFEEFKDNYGNALTETTFTDGEFGTLYRAFAYGNNANDLIYETDARGGETTYEVDGNTSRNTEVVDRLGEKTAYEYDEAGRTTKVLNFAAQRNEDGSVVVDAQGKIQYTETPMAEVSYAYNAFDAMTEIVRGDGLKYVLAYNSYGNLESIGIDGKSSPLVQYNYKNGSGRLKQVTYANGDTMKATYNTAGQMIAEKWYDKTGMPIAKYKYAYDGQGNIVRSIDICALKEYAYTYEDGKLMRAAEYDITVNSDEIVTSRTLKASILYTYDNEGHMISKRVRPVGGTQPYVYYETSDDNTVVKFNVRRDMDSPRENLVTITAHSKTDSFGRKEFDEVQLSSGFVSRRFRYLEGELTQNHINARKLKSSPTTQLVSEILYADGRTIAYEYDAEERITKVTDSVDGITEYTYDALGQLLTETRNGELVNEMEYDNYGNIVSKNGVEYTYDSVWKDLLTSYCDQQIVYDNQGNPTTYRGHALRWEKGRQLKSIDLNSNNSVNPDIVFTYNANGIRTSKTVNGIKHEYLLEGTKILRETWTDENDKSHVLVPLYDNEDSVCGVEYNTEPFFFMKNLQGDIIAITDNTGTVKARYTYDAWGVCEIAHDDTDCDIANINPFRYRGYYYDTETNLYYLQSRYYDPQVGRFINADDASILNFTGITSIETNIFAYCFNNPVSDGDIGGYIALQVIIAAAIGGVVGAVLEIILQMLQGRKLKTLDWSSIIIEFFNGAFTGALIGFGLNPGFTTFGRALINMVTSIAHSIRKKDNFWIAIGLALLSGLGTYVWGYGKWSKGKAIISKKVITAIVESLKTRFARFSLRVFFWRVSVRI